jgi:drug efflux transport system permease protein
VKLRRARAVARKELLHIVRDPRSLTMALILPLMMLLLFGFALSLDVDEIPTIVLDRDQSPQSRELVGRFVASGYFTLTGVVGGYGEIESEIDHDRALLALVIPDDFSERLARGEEGTFQILLDGSDSNTASIALSYAEGVIQLEGRALAGSDVTGRPATSGPRIRVWYNSALESKNYIVPGLVAVILMIISALLTSLTIAREWETGTMEQILSTPLRPVEIVVGKMSAFFLLGLVNATTAVTLGYFVFDVPLRGNLGLLFVTTSVFLFTAFGWGILLSAIARSQLLAFQMGIMSSFLPAFLLSGFVFAIDNMPRVVQVFTYIVPARYFVTILKGIYLKGVGATILAGDIAFLVVFSAIVFALATRKISRGIA